MAMLLVAGLVATAIAALALLRLALGGEAAAPFPGHGWWGLGALAGLELLLVLRVAVVATFFTALAWTAYIAVMDAAVYRRRGGSLLRSGGSPLFAWVAPVGRPGGALRFRARDVRWRSGRLKVAAGGSFIAMCALSIPAWLIFELYNLHLRNWIYVGVPGPFWNFALGAAWAFATIFPGIFETADLIHCAWAGRLRSRPWGARRLRAWPWMLLGAAMVAGPLVAPAAWAPYWFGPVWAGWVLVLDPLNRAWGWPSLLGDVERGRPGRSVALLLAGAACGFFWEFWNYWALARWQYVFPIFHRFRIFAMPVPGFLGFPPFALECFALYIFLSRVLLPPRLRAALIEEIQPS